MSDESKQSKPMEDVGKPNPQNLQNQELSGDDLDKVTGGITTRMVHLNCRPKTRGTELQIAI